jgi:superfamily II DNA or RNA helicase
METVTKSRIEIQSEMKEAAIKSLDLVNKAVLKASVGIGKSLVALQIADHYKPTKVTWLTNSEELRDNDAPAEFFKWGFEHLHEVTTFMCVQSACKLQGEDLGFIILDEADFACTEVYFNAILNNNYTKCLLVSGTYTEEKLVLLESLGFPLVYDISTNEAQDLGILNNTFIHFVEYDLDKTKDILVETKTKSWYSSENDLYVYQENQFIATIIAYEKLKKSCKDHYDGVAPIPNFNYDQFKRDKLNYQKKLKWIGSARAKVLHTLNSSKRIARTLADKILEGEDNKVMIFSSLTEHIDSFVPHTIHSKNKKGNKNLDLFNQGVIRELGVISMIDRGKNMVGLNYSIFESFDGSETKMIQRLGRNARLDSEDTAHIYVLLPYFTNKAGKRLPTRAVGWAYSGFNNYRLDDSNSRTFHINQLNV